MGPSTILHSPSSPTLVSPSGAQSLFGAASTPPLSPRGSGGSPQSPKSPAFKFWNNSATSGPAISPSHSRKNQVIPPVFIIKEPPVNPATNSRPFIFRSRCMRGHHCSACSRSNLCLQLLGCQTCLPERLADAFECIHAMLSSAHNPLPSHCRCSSTSRKESPREPRGPSRPWQRSTRYSTHNRRGSLVQVSESVNRDRRSHENTSLLVSHPPSQTAVHARVCHTLPSLLAAGN